MAQEDTGGHTNNRYDLRRYFVIPALFLVMIFLHVSPGVHPPAPRLRPVSLFVSPPIFAQDSKSEVISDRSRTESCSATSKVGFMKTHKTASSTVQNILFRFGLNSGWNFVLPDRGSHLGPPEHQYQLTVPYNSSWYQEVSWAAMAQQQGYNIFALHTKWSQDQVAKVLGSSGGDTKFITILRNPVDNFESLYNYVHFNQTFNMTLEEFVNEYIKKRQHIERVHEYLGQNQQLWDLGLSAESITNLTAVKEKIERIDKDFDLVMIKEDFDASLVLLSEELCWPLANMTSLKVNARKKSAVEKLSQDAREILQDWLWADQMLYDHFKGKLDKRKEEFGLLRMERQISKLKDLNAEVKSLCVLETVKDTQKLSEEYIPYSQDVVGFDINDETNPYCKFYGMSEISFIDTIRSMQEERCCKDEWIKDERQESHKLTVTSLED